MKNLLIKFIKNHKFTSAMIILDLIMFILFFYTQQLIFILFSFIFFIILMITIASILVIIIWYLVKMKLKSLGKCIIKSKRNYSTLIIIFLMIIISYPIFITYIENIPNFKGYINEGYFQETVNEIVKGKVTDNEKIGAILEWFDDDKNNLYDSWILTHSDKPWFNPIGTYIIFLTEEPYICIRCYEENDPKWLLTSRCGACGEYSRLFMIMVDYLDYDVKRVHAQGEDHVWNEVKIGEIWIPVDPTNVSLIDGSDGWEDYSFFKWKEGNVSYVWAEYLHNNTIEDLTSMYTNLTNITIHCKDDNNSSFADMAITIMSNNLHDENRIHETFIKDKPKPKTNKSGYCSFQIGGGTYKLKANNDEYSGETEWIKFSDEIPQHYYSLVVKEKCVRNKNG